MALLRSDSTVGKMARTIYRTLVAERVVEGPQFETLQSLEQLIPGLYNRQVKLHPFKFQWGDLWNDNLLILYCCLVAAGHTPVLEFGTFRGRTAYNMALNTSGRITTIDIGPRIGTAVDVAANVDGHEYPNYVPGEAFLTADSDVRSQIDLLIGDSTKLDLTHLYATTGLVIVDGGHSYEVCKSDSERALNLVRPGGVVIWDDYGDYWPGVKRAVNEIGEHVKLYWLHREGAIAHIAN